MTRPSSRISRFSLSRRWAESTPFWLALLALWLLFTPGLRPLLVPDEGRYAGVARAMWLAGDPWVPRLNGLPFFHKPPLMYWLDMAAYALFGVNATTARFAPAFGGWLLGATLFVAVRRWYGSASARVALCVLATCPLFFLSAQYANLDLLVAGTLTACVLAFARAVDGGGRSLRWLLVAWAAAGLSVLAKGLIGVVLPALVVVPWLCAQRRWRTVLWLLHPIGLLLFAAIALPWGWAMQARYPAFFDYFIVEQHFRRFAQTNFNNGHGVWYYPVLLPLLTLPWSLWLPTAVGRVRGAWSRQTPVARWRVALFGWWLFVIVGFFSLPRSKLVGYVLPALGPWCLLLAQAARLQPRRYGWTAVVAALVGLGGVLYLTVQPLHSARDAGLALARLHTPGEAIVFVDDPFYDLPFYAGLGAPVLIASRWDDPELALHDNWRKELADAARFEPERGRALLRPLDRLADLTCGASPVWFVVKPGRAALIATVPGAMPVFDSAEARLFKAPPRRCS